MIDIHSHILHGLDDGSKSLEESLEMLRVASAAGTTDIVATPHADLQYCFKPELVAPRRPPALRIFTPAAIFTCNTRTFRTRSPILASTPSTNAATYSSSSRIC